MYNNANCKCKQLDIKYSSLSTYIACEGTDRENSAELPKL